jgi:hypothetical protein
VFLFLVAGLDGSPRRIESLRPSERGDAFARRMARYRAKVNGFWPNAILAKDRESLPDSFTHGSSADRVAALQRGLQSGNVTACGLRR